ARLHGWTLARRGAAGTPKSRRRNLAGRASPLTRPAAPMLCSISFEFGRDSASTMIRSYQGKTPVIPKSCYVDESAQIIGDVVLGEHASVWMNAVLRGDVHSIRVGAHS